MKNRLRLLIIAAFGSLPLLTMGLFAAPAAATASCTPTGFIRDGINLTAAQIGGNVIGGLNATGCNIGVYYDKNHKGTVANGDIFGANYYGVLVDGGQGDVNVNILASKVHNIGEVPFNGSQHGNAIYYYGQGTSGKVSGSVVGNTVSNYQKGGIIVNGTNANVSVIGNTVIGLGLVNFIAQNGIQISRGAQGSVTANNVSANAYAGANGASSCGILVYGGQGDPLTTNISVSANTLKNNDVGICLANYSSDGNAGPSSPTRNLVQANMISSSAVTNVSGNGGSVGYQAGISDAGNQDVISINSISGPGYATENPGGVHNAFVRPIDVTPPYAISPIVRFNTPSY